MRLSFGCLVCYLFVILGSNNCFAASADRPSLEPLSQIDSTTSTLADFIEQYQAAIEEIEFQGGVYDSKLTQELLNLGTVYQNYGKHEDAIKILNRSLHLSRINEGLYSPSQIPILEKIIQSLKKLKRWQLVNKRYDYQHWLYARNFDQNNIKMLEIDLKMANWYLYAYTLKLAPNPAQDLLSSFALFNKATQLISKEYGVTDLRLIDALNGLMIANYLVATHVPTTPPEHEFADNGHHMVKKTFSNIDYMKRKSFNTGRNIIERELKVLSNQEVKDHVQIIKSILKLADWHLMYNKHQPAMAHYQEAYNYAVKNETDNEFVNQLFTQPVTLPNFPNMNNNSSINLSDSALAADVKYVHASFNITRFGKAKNIKIIDSNPPDNTGMRAKVLRNLRVAKFRPRIADGVPILTEQTQIHVFVK